MIAALLLQNNIVPVMSIWCNDDNISLGFCGFFHFLVSNYVCFLIAYNSFTFPLQFSILNYKSFIFLYFSLLPFYLKIISIIVSTIVLLQKLTQQTCCGKPELQWNWTVLSASAQFHPSLGSFWHLKRDSRKHVMIYGYWAEILSLEVQDCFKEMQIWTIKPLI